MPDDFNVPWSRSASDRDRNHNMGAICGFMLTVIQTQRPNESAHRRGRSAASELETAIARPRSVQRPGSAFLVSSDDHCEHDQQDDAGANETIRPPVQPSVSVIQLTRAEHEESSLAIERQAGKE